MNLTNKDKLTETEISRLIIEEEFNLPATESIRRTGSKMLAEETDRQIEEYLNGYSNQSVSGENRYAIVPYRNILEEAYDSFRFLHRLKHAMAISLGLDESMIDDMDVQFINHMANIVVQTAKLDKIHIARLHVELIERLGEYYRKSR